MKARPAIEHLPALRELIGAYLYQSWRVEFPSWRMAVKQFVVESPTAVKLADEIDGLLALSMSDHRLRDYLLGRQEPGFDIGEEMTLTDWLREVRELVSNRDDP